jgi:MFS transporter, FHS family, L-fucose permease
MAISPVADTQAPVAGAPSTSYKGAMAMVTTLFFMWGFLTCLNDILIPHLKSIFDLNYTQVLLIQFSFFSAYAIFSLPSGKIIDWLGYQRAMVFGLCTMGVGALLFVPAASLPSFPLFLGALIILAAGMTVLQTSANPYVALLGPPRTASSRLNLTQAFNSLGTFIAPYIGGTLILGAVAAPLAAEKLRELAPDALQQYRITQAASVKLPYIGFAAVLFLIAIIIGFFNLPKIASAQSHGEKGTSYLDLLHHPHAIYGALGIFTYVGAEVAIGSFLINYLNHPAIGNLSLTKAAYMLAYYWGGAMVGRFIGSALLQKLPTGKLLAFNAAMACILVITSMLTVGHVAMWSVLLIGFFNSIMFPSIFTLSIDGLGALTSKGSAVLVAAIVGGAIIPELQAIMADRVGIHHAFILPALCYLYIIYFALKGSRKRATSAA